MFAQMNNRWLSSAYIHINIKPSAYSWTDILTHKHSAVYGNDCEAIMSALQGPLVSAKWLASRILGGGGGGKGAGAVPGLRVVDASWYMPNANRNPAEEHVQKRMWCGDGCVGGWVCAWV